MNTPEPRMKITVKQLRSLQQWLQQWKDDHQTTYTAMSRQCDLGKGTIASIVSTPIFPHNQDNSVLEEAPTWRLVKRIAKGLEQELGTIIPESLWLVSPLSSQKESGSEVLSDRKVFPYSLYELGSIGTERCKNSALYNLPVSWEEKIEFHGLLMHGVIGDLISKFRTQSAKSCAHDLARIIIMAASLGYQFELDLEGEVATLARYYSEHSSSPS